jgi:hypothetical protein
MLRSSLMCKWKTKPDFWIEPKGFQINVVEPKPKGLENSKNQTQTHTLKFF